MCRGYLALSPYADQGREVVHKYLEASYSASCIDPCGLLLNLFNQSLSLSLFFPSPYSNFYYSPHHHATYSPL